MQFVFVKFHNQYQEFRVFIFAKNTNSLPAVSPIGFPFYELSEVDSSNNYAMRQIQAQMADHGTVYFTHYQNAGKGQRGKTWKAEPGTNLMMSCVIEPAILSIDNQFLLNVAVALACHDLFVKYAVDSTTVKWPNDLYWRDRKAGGVLIENVLQGRDWKYAVVGIGININQTLFPDYLPNPVSLKQITGRDFDTVLLARELCEYLEQRWQQLKLKEGDQLLQDYNQILFGLNETRPFKKDNAVFNAVVKGVNRQGELVIDTGAVSAIPFGSIEWIIN